MWTLLIVAVFVLCRGQATRLQQEFHNLTLQAKYGPDLPATTPGSFKGGVLNSYASYEGLVYLNSLPKIIKSDPVVIKQYRPFKLDIPGRKPGISFYLNNTEVSGLKKSQIYNLKWRLDENRIDFISSIPHLTVDVNTDILIDLDPSIFNEETLTTSVRITVRFMDLYIKTALRYNTGVLPNEQALFIDAADVHIHTKEALFYINIVYGLEEIRYELADVFNYPLEDIMGAVLKEAVQGINEKVLATVKPKDIIDFVVDNIDKKSKQYASTLTIKHI